MVVNLRYLEHKNYAQSLNWNRLVIGVIIAEILLNETIYIKCDVRFKVILENSLHRGIGYKGYVIGGLHCNSKIWQQYQFDKQAITKLKNYYRVKI